jgi:protein-L-isoaspartate(D-aspartate) O-methyltransferase
MDWSAAREQMVAQQIAARGVSDARVLAAMRAVPRHRFVPAAHQHQAYADRPLPIGEGQTISQPFMVAVMTAALGLRPTDRVLEVGTGSGYQTAVLAQLGGHVVSVERHAALAEGAARVLRELAISGVDIVVSDGTEGWPAGAPYDRILVTAGAPALPDSLTAQLAEAGRLVIPVGPLELQHVTVVDRVGDQMRVREGDPCVFVPLIGRHGWPEQG